MLRLAGYAVDTAAVADQGLGIIFKVGIILIALVALAKFFRVW